MSCDVLSGTMPRVNLHVVRHNADFSGGGTPGKLKKLPAHTACGLDAGKNFTVPTRLWLEAGS